MEDRAFSVHHLSVALVFKRDKVFYRIFWLVKSSKENVAKILGNVAGCFYELLADVISYRLPQ